MLEKITINVDVSCSSCLLESIEFFSKAIHFVFFAFNVVALRLLDVYFFKFSIEEC